MSFPDLLITLTHHENNPNNVTIAFTMGVKALEKGKNVAILLLSDAVHLAKKGYADKIDIGEPFQPIKDVLPAFLEKGGKIKVCSSCLIHNGIKESEIMENIDIITADEVVDYITEAKSTLQLN